ncbi:chromosomal organization and DNA repair protein Mms21 [Emericellopsis cladophorae]|uniref:Chromosomal organization and DNA repair protein Mms21 n=1 Tax=Emericellopsis cladophorae TaxID=2686198 RepID=A0A9P9XWZ3_9HYPO|nr:chromosomal organization and DNA repair protein Mms21 [Emericellopsis cladophorae]KAI6779379.1 chromosomal organization and DNA repair protein Mms21 [Emericellopsis cladophorae]
MPAGSTPAATPSWWGGKDVGSDGTESEDENIAVEGDVVSLICPMAQQVIAEPFRNCRCKHAFEKKTILDHLLVSDPIQCPRTGCSQQGIMAILQNSTKQMAAMKEKIGNRFKFFNDILVDIDDNIDNHVPRFLRPVVHKVKKAEDGQDFYVIHRSKKISVP